MSVSVSAALDPRLVAFCSEQAPEVFHGVAHREDIWKPDPFDVPTIHQEAREAFERLLRRATTPPGPSSGRVLLLLGESGSGKTHLLRVFRNSVHQRRLGYCGYMQMTTRVSNYGRYLLSNLIDSLDQPYYLPDGDTSGLMHLSQALAEAAASTSPEALRQLREEDLDREQVNRLVYDLADQVLRRWPALDLGLVRSLLYLQRDEARLKSLVLSYLRCEDLPRYDREYLGDLVPRTQEEDPQRLAEQLGRLMGCVQQTALVLCVDQLEEMFDQQEETAERFRRAMTALCALSEHVPSAVVVIACLEDYYQKLKGQLTRPLLDRIEKDPDPLTLHNRRSWEEIVALVSRRLRFLYENAEVVGAVFNEAEPIYPLPEAELRKLVHLRTRDILDWCRQYRETCRRAGGLALPDEEPDARQTTSQTLALEQAWNDFLATYHLKDWPPKDNDLAVLLAEAIRACAGELTAGHWFDAEADGWMIAVTVHEPDKSVRERLLIGLCNRAAQGGGLQRQINEVEKRAGDGIVPVIARLTDFPKSPKAMVAQQLGSLIARGGRRTVIEDADWRAFSAFQEFYSRHKQQPHFADWQRVHRPLTCLKSLQRILALEQLQTTSAGHPQQAEEVARVPEAPLPPPPAPASTSEATPSTPSEPLTAGVRCGQRTEPVFLEPGQLVRHLAFLGGSGSGKTTAALNIIEQLLVRGIPAVLVDRKGDLCGYARIASGPTSPENPQLAARREQLCRSVEVVVYTPGNPQGNPLALPLVPQGLNQLESWERERLAGFAATSLGSMMGYKDTGRDASCLAILKQAISLLSLSGEDITFQTLLPFIGQPDPALLAAIGQLEERLCRRLAQDLQTLQLNRGWLFQDGPPLRAETLLGQDRPAAGRTRLSILSTKFLGSQEVVQFWVAQLLQELSRWASRRPSSTLQALLFLDEADLYLPASSKPVTKELIENLLKRGRSAGLSLCLATQSPGDLDYRCRDNILFWFLGRITQDTALNKLRPLVSDLHQKNILAQLPKQECGQFYLVAEKEVINLRAGRAVLHTEQLSEEEILQLARQSRLSAD